MLNDHQFPLENNYLRNAKKTISGAKSPSPSTKTNLITSYPEAFQSPLSPNERYRANEERRKKKKRNYCLFFTASPLINILLR